MQAIDTRALGLAVIGLGGGRRRPEDAIDPAVGFSQLAFCSERVGAGRPLALVHAKDRAAAEQAAAALLGAYRIGERADNLPALVTRLP